MVEENVMAGTGTIPDWVTGITWVDAVMYTIAAYAVWCVVATVFMGIAGLVFIVEDRHAGRVPVDARRSRRTRHIQQSR